MINADDLTARQAQILKCVVEEYIETAEAVGSKVLDSKYQMGVSPATIRNEMVKLINAGYLKQPHTSSGRVPTPKALKLYINRLMKQKSLSVSEEVAVKQKVWDVRGKIDKFLHEATKALADATNTLAIATTDNDEFYYAGVCNLLETPEFMENVALAHTVYEMLDNDDWWKKIFMRIGITADPFFVLMGDEWERPGFEPCGYVFSQFQAGPNIRGSIGVIGPMRLNYSYIIPTVEYVSNLISEVGKK